MENAYENIKLVLEKARTTAYRAVNSTMTEAYWNIGRIIIEEEQKGRGKSQIRAKPDKTTVRETNQRLRQRIHRNQPKIHEAILPDIPKKSCTE